jgi:hypothetical protein
MENKLCPICGCKLVRGRAAVRKSIGAKLQWPFPSDRLFYKPDGEDQKSVTILREGVSHEAFRCNECGAMLLTGERWVLEP